MTNTQSVPVWKLSLWGDTCHLPNDVSEPFVVGTLHIQRPGLFVFTHMLMWSIFFFKCRLKNSVSYLGNAQVKIWK